jgi:hypothetical protein
MSREKLKDTTFLGIVVDNNDPEKMGRCKIKVFQVFDRHAEEDIPWARPWKDLNGNQFILPDVGKHVSVVFDQGNKYAPEYIYAQNFNINLENKLKKLDGDAYRSMRAVMFDHSTQIYSNSADGLVMDHEYSNINIQGTGNIHLNLRDNGSIITLGSTDANEMAVLGTQFMAWMDDFVEVMMGAKGSPFLDATGAPVTPNVNLVKSLTAYRKLKDKFLSKHVMLPKNDNVLAQKREYIKQSGDGETSSISAASPQPVSTVYDENTGTTTEYAPKDPNKTTDPPNPPPPTGGRSYSTGGTTMTICGKVRNNGEVEDLLAEINKDLYKHKGALSSDNGRIRLQKNAMADLERMLVDAEKDKVFLKVNSAYRTYQDQARIWSENCSNAQGSGRCVARAGQSPAAVVGTSNHGFGLAVDLANRNGKKVTPGGTPTEWNWIQANKHKYNFEQQNNTNETHHYNYTKPGVNCP